jgi:hypothetical protein
MTTYRGYGRGRDLDTMISAARQWFAEHRGGQVPKMQWLDQAGVQIIGSLTQYVETVACNAAGSVFLKALDSSVDGRATVIMAQVAHYEATHGPSGGEL